jgi:hypothetical protein
MRRLAIIGVVLGVAGLILWHSVYHPTDYQIRARMVGAWINDSDPAQIVEQKTDGTFVVTKSGRDPIFGTWQVHNGFAVGTVTNVTSVDGHFQSASNKVLRVVGNRMVVLSTDGRSELTLHRR